MSAMVVFGVSGGEKCPTHSSGGWHDDLTLTQSGHGAAAKLLDLRTGGDIPCLTLSVPIVMTRSLRLSLAFNGNRAFGRRVTFVPANNGDNF